MPGTGRRVARRTLLLLLVAVAGAAASMVVTRDGTSSTTVIRALGGSVAVKPGAAGSEPLTAWPAKPGWTIVLVSVPKAEGRDEALAVAEAARARDLPDVGILDSSRTTSVRPGYWLVFTGVYAAEAEATGALRPARALMKTARVQRIAR
jgi:ABC-type glycerol-3-phosphate transport system substrate-binding protein